ncbi:hypothetical protein ACFS07_26055 [Undibacterium arcticum]
MKLVRNAVSTSIVKPIKCAVDVQWQKKFNRDVQSTSSRVKALRPCWPGRIFLGRAALKVIKQVTVQLAMVRRIGCRQQTVGPRTDAK